MVKKSFFGIVMLSFLVLPLMYAGGAVAETATGAPQKERAPIRLSPFPKQEMFRLT